MTTLQHWTIALDFGPADHTLLEYVKLLANILEPKKIDLIHVEPALDIPPGLDSELPDLREKHIEFLRNKLEKLVDEHLTGVATQIDCKVYEGHPFNEMLRHSRDQETDLLIMGKKASGGQGLIVRKMARKGPCSLLVVPETASARISHILIPIDFSEYAHECVIKATNLCRKIPGSSMTIQHVYNSADLYLNRMHETSFEVEEHLQQKATLNVKLKQYHEEKIREFVEQYDLNDIFFQTKLSPQTAIQGSVSKLIMRDAQKLNADLIIMGAKGQNSPLAVLMGNVAEKVNRLDKKIPLLILKKKGENKSLLQALLGG
ncbi:MAG: universal stress protein [Cyclobacteriaceae bacterium]